MTSFFKRLFGKKEIEPQVTPLIVKPKITFRVEVVQSEATENSKENISSQEIQKSSIIAEIKKQSTQINKKEGTLAAINFIKKFIETNDLGFKEIVSLLKKVAPYMKKENTISDLETVTYLCSYIEKYSEKDQIENYKDIASIVGCVDNIYALNYLVKKLDNIEIDEHNVHECFDLLIKLSDYYLLNKQADKAFGTIRMAANLLVTHISDVFYYLSKQIIIAEKFANVCLAGQKKPQYADYLYYEVVAFILNITGDALGFPHLTGFFHRKKICYNESWPFENDFDFNKSLEDLKIMKHKKELVEEIYNYAFNEMPIKIGIPKEYLIESALSGWLDNRTTRNEIMAITETLKPIPFDQIAALHEFVANVLKKYYDKENQPLL